MEQVLDFLWELKDVWITLLLLAGGLAAVLLIKRRLLKRWEKKAGETESGWDDFIVTLFGKTMVPLLFFGLIYVTLNNLLTSTQFRAWLRGYQLEHLAVKALGTLDLVGLALITFLVIRLACALLPHLMESYWKRKDVSEGMRRGGRGLVTIARGIFWVVGVLFFLDNMGIKVTTVVAGLGITGIAVALAAQTILGDLFNYLAILFDRPFEVGDFIILGEYLGTVEHIGLKTTRVRSLGGEQLVFSNSDLTGSRVRNYKRMQQRRVVFKIGVVYQTTAEQMKAIPGIIRETIESIPDTRFDRCHFSAFGDFSLDVETVYFVLSSDYAQYMDIQQKINLTLMEEFAKRGIGFAYPTQTVFIEK